VIRATKPKAYIGSCGRRRKATGENSAAKQTAIRLPNRHEHPTLPRLLIIEIIGAGVNNLGDGQCGQVLE
jgi:hypothetical protein